MKEFAGLFVCLVASVTSLPVDLSESSELAANNKVCIDRTGVTLEQIEELREDPREKTSKPGMCYVKCMAELAGVEKDGLIQKGTALAKRSEGVTNEDAEKFIEECSKLNADDPCERSFIKYICVFERSESKATWLKTDRSIKLDDLFSHFYYY